ncbi:MAG: ParB/RepB/Spo0J family partition protein [Planctomycetota bacterium]|jgi:ParB family chromosome partitioning protein
MGEEKQQCAVCGGGGFWQSLLGGVRKLVPFGKRREKLEHVGVDRIDDNPHQPRTYILAEPHDDLKMSIAQYGVIVPIIVNRMKGGRYTLVAGQRRLEAARELGHEAVPAVVRSMNKREMMEVTYLENLHREDLSRVDVVRMFDRIKRRYPQLREEELAVAMGLERNGLSEARALLDLPIPALEALRAGMISEEHARAVSEIDDPDRMLEVIEAVYRETLDVECTQALVDRVLNRPARFIANDDSPHYHRSSCPFARLIPPDRRARFYSRKEAVKRGKIACMNCL